MKKKLMLLSSLFVLGSATPAMAKDIENVKEEVQTLMQQLNEKLLELRSAYGDGMSKVGEPIIFESGLIITIDNVEVSTEEPSYPELGGNLVRIDFTIDNQSPTEQSLNGHHVELYDGDRVKAEIDSKDFWSENIASGMKATGVVYRHAHTLGEMTIVIGAGQWSADVE